MGQIAFTSYEPQALVGVNSPSSTLCAEVVTGSPIPTGARPGVSFFVGKKLAAYLSTPYFPVYPGWYREVMVDAGATAANIAFGAILAQLSIGTSTDLDNQVTDLTHCLNPGIAPCVALTGGLGLLVNGAYAPASSSNPVAGLAAMTPGNYTFVQDSGDATLLVAAGQTVSVGSVLATQASSPTGPVVVAGSITDTVYSTIVGIAQAALTTPSALTGSAVAAASAGVAVYTGTYTGGGSSAFAGQQAVITGASNSANNGTFLITASTTTTLTLVNPNAVAETHAHTATLQGLVRARLGFPFGQQL